MVADDLPGSWKGSKPRDQDATRDTDGKAHRRAGMLSCGAIELRGGGVAGDQRAESRRLRDCYEAEGAEGLID